MVGEEGEQDLSNVPADFIVKDAEAVNMTCTDQFKDSKVPTSYNKRINNTGNCIQKNPIYLRHINDT